MEEFFLYNNRRFPNYVFSDRVKSSIFIEFDTVFTPSFLKTLRNFLVQKDIKQLKIQNIEPKDYFFNETIDVSKLPDSFIESACLEKVQEYIDTPASFYMLTELGLIFPIENSEMFCLYLDRRFSLAIIGSSEMSNAIFFQEFKIIDLFDYLTMTFQGDEPPQEITKKMKKYWTGE